MDNRVVTSLVVTACIVGIIVGAIWIAQRVHYGCLFGNCAVVMTK